MRSTYIYTCKYDEGRRVRCVPIPSEGHGAPVGSHCAIAHHRRTHACTTLPSSSFLPGLFIPQSCIFFTCPAWRLGPSERSLNSDALLRSIISLGGARDLHCLHDEIHW